MKAFGCLVSLAMLLGGAGLIAYTFVTFSTAYTTINPVYLIAGGLLFFIGFCVGGAAWFSIIKARTSARAAEWRQGQYDPQLLQQAHQAHRWHQHARQAHQQFHHQAVNNFQQQWRHHH